MKLFEDNNKTDKILFASFLIDWKLLSVIQSDDMNLTLQNCSNFDLRNFIIFYSIVAFASRTKIPYMGKCQVNKTTKNNLKYK